MSQKQLKTTYNGIKNDFRTKQQNAQIRLNAQQTITRNHFNQSMKSLEQQFKETERQRKIQQAILAKHYQHQKDLMQQRHEELLKLKSRLNDVSHHENHQIEQEEKLQQRHQRLMQIQNDYDMRQEHIHSNRGLLEQRKKTILDEMKKFDDLTQNMSKLNLNGTQLTDQEKQELDEFVSQYPEATIQNYDYQNYHQFRHSVDDDDEYQSEYSRISRKRKSQMKMKRNIRRERSSSRSPSNSTRKSRKIRRKSRKRRDFRELTRSQSPVVRRSYKRRKSNKGIAIQVRNASNPRKSRRRSKSVGRRSRSQSKKRMNRKRNDINRKSRSRKKDYNDKKSGNLYVRLVNARGVFGIKGSRPNTYVELECNGQISTSSVIKKNNNPEWNEFFKFYVNDYDRSTLTVRLIDAKNEKSIAKMRIPVNEFVEKHNKMNYSMSDDVSMYLDIDYKKGGPSKDGSFGKTGIDMLRKSILQMK